MAPEKGKTRCKWHGGRSTGPLTPEGKARSIAAAVAGRARWMARMKEMKAAGLIAKIPTGRKPGFKLVRKIVGELTGDPVIDAAKKAIAERRAEKLRHCPHCGGELDGEFADFRADRGQRGAVDVHQPGDDPAPLSVAEMSNEPASRPTRRSRARFVSVVPAGAAGKGAVETPRASLDRINRKSLALIERIVDMPIDRHLDIGMQLKLLGIKKDAAQSMAALQARVDGNSLKAREVDMMPELIERLAKIEEAKE